MVGVVLSLDRNIGDTYLLLETVEVIDDDTNKQVECEERTNDDENNKEQVILKGGLSNLLLVHL